MKLANILLEQQDEFNIGQKTAELENAVNRELAKYNPSIRLGAYSQPRPEGDKNRNRGFGKITFMYREYDGLPEQDFSKAKNILQQNNYEVVEEANYYESEPGERDIYPTIKFEFDLM